MTKMNEKDMQEVNGGSWVIPEEEGKAAGLTLINDDGSPGSWGTFYNSGNYLHFYTDFGRAPKTLEEALEHKR